MSKMYNHAFDIAFEVTGSKCPEGTDVTQEMIVEAIRERADRLEHECDAREAVGAPYDTYDYINSDRLTMDARLTVEQLEDEYSKDGHGEYPHEPLYRSEWRLAVAEDQTISGYWSWVYNKLNDMAN